jgi:hypothetical protein
MTAPRVACAARLIYRDQHQAVERWWTLMTPEGDLVALCSLACVLTWVCYRDWPSEIGVNRTAPEEAA